MDVFVWLKKFAVKLQIISQCSMINGKGLTMNDGGLTAVSRVSRAGAKSSNAGQIKQGKNEVAGASPDLMI